MARPPALASAGTLTAIADSGSPRWLYRLGGDRGAGTPVEWRSVTPHVMQDDCQFPRNCDYCPFASQSFNQCASPLPERREQRRSTTQAGRPRDCHLSANSVQTVEHPFGTIKSWMGSTHFQMKTLKHVSTEMALHVLAYNMKRVMNILGVGGLMEAIRA